MKGILKLFPAALAVLALASCSNDELLEQKSQQYSTSEAGDLVVTVEPFDGQVATRALRDANGGSLTFVKGDQINVYDDELYKYTIYDFTEGTGDAKGYFKKSGGVDLATPKYGLFPGNSINRGYYDSKTGLTIAEFAIPHVINYNELSEQKVNGKMLYAANLPMFGLATVDGEKVRISNLRHVCTVLKINLENVQDNVTWLKLSVDDESEFDLSGTFPAVLDASSEEARKAVHLEKGKSDLKTYKEIFINLQDVPSRKATLYLPVMPGIKANTDGLKLEYENTALTEEDVLAGAGLWTDTGLKFPKEEFKANQLKEASWAFELTEMTPFKLSNLIEKYKNSEEDLDFELADGFAIGNPGTAYDDGSWEINIPALKDGVDVNVTLGENFDEWADDGAFALTIQDADKAEPFTGKFSLNVDAILNSATTADATEIYIDLPQADVELAGDLSKFDTEDITILNAKSITFGDGETETNVLPATLYIATDALAADGDLKALTVANKAYLKADIDGENAGLIPAYPVYKGFELTINGKVEGDIDLSTRFGSTVTIGSNLDYLPADERTAVVGNVTTGSETVNIALGSEGQAIDGRLTMTGAMADLNMKQGYVNELSIDVRNNGDWENYRYVNINMEEETGPVAFLDIVEATQGAPNDKGGWFNWTKSVWAGKTISDVAYAPSGNNYKNKYTQYVELDRANNTLNTAVKGAIFTSSQLSALEILAEVAELKNDLDLNSKPWISNSLKNDFHGNDHVVSNLALNTTSSGLFKDIPSGTLAVKDLKIEGVTNVANATGAVIGALAGTINANVTIQNVDVTDINIESAKRLDCVGGIVGTVYAGKTVNMKAVTAAGSIKGYRYLGGIAGRIAGTLVTDAATTAQVAVTNNFNIGKAMELDCATIGGFIGECAGTVNIASPAPTAPVHAYADKEYLSDTSVSTGDFFYYTMTQNYIGYSGTGATNITIGGKQYYPAKIGDASKKYDGSAWGAALPLYTLLAK